MLSKNLPYSYPNTNAGAAFQAVTVTSAAAALATLLPPEADTNFVTVYVEANAIRLTPNGTTPTGSLGIRLEPGDSVDLSRAEYDTAKVIRADGVDATIQISQSK